MITLKHRLRDRSICENRISRALSVLLVTLSLLVFSSSPYAQRVEPMIFELEPVGTNSSASLRVENNKEQTLTVEFVATKMSLDEYGKETRVPADDDFLIYPPQALIKGGKTQVVKVKYIGDPSIAESNAYRVSVKQVPVHLDDADFKGVGVVVNFNTLVNVSPADSESVLTVSDIELGEDDRWNIIINNTGNRFSRLSKTTWEVSSTVDSSKKMYLRKSEVAQIADKNLVLPNSKLRLSIPAFGGYEPGTTKIEIVSGS